ncbi:MAG TPA: hypothetical protein DEA90_00265 [Opitutae bacterium]|nr:hypothetical protein [Puniceicoccaceae bacterium]HBR92581.1 hypothetical protein [Opitutae bacterium]|tara:strand:+ start:16888 stop:17403 length:516 start_codon:yes stop_codon:yes gene_type:complete
MFIINDAFQSGVIEACSTASSRRYYRGRNSASANADGWHFPPELPSDQPDVAEILEHSSRAGIKAVRQSLVPACFVWALMALIALAYYWLPAASHFFIGLERLQAFLGRLFPFLGMGLSVGVLAELVRILSAGKKVLGAGKYSQCGLQSTGVRSPRPATRRLLPATNSLVW